MATQYAPDALARRVFTLAAGGIAIVIAACTIVLITSY